jgi:hypothetical protein
LINGRNSSAIVNRSHTYILLAIITKFIVNSKSPTGNMAI